MFNDFPHIQCVRQTMPPKQVEFELYCATNKSIILESQQLFYRLSNQIQKCITHVKVNSLPQTPLLLYTRIHCNDRQTGKEEQKQKKRILYTDDVYSRRFVYCLIHQHSLVFSHLIRCTCKWKNV